MEEELTLGSTNAAESLLVEGLWLWPLRHAAPAGEQYDGRQFAAWSLESRFLTDAGLARCRVFRFVSGAYNLKIIKSG